MTRKRWKPVQPHSLEHATRLCTDYALHRHNRSVAQIADLVGVSEWSVYKWIADGCIPTRRIRPFEFACDATFITQWIAGSAQKLVIDIPAGKARSQNDLMDLQTCLNKAVEHLSGFYREQRDVEATLEGVTQAIKQLAGHRENVRKASAPELELFEGA